MRQSRVSGLCCFAELAAVRGGLRFSAMELAKENHIHAAPNTEKKMEKNSSLLQVEGKESLKLRISTNHADGTSKIVANHISSSLNHNHVSKDKDGIHRDASSKPKHGGTGDKRDHKHKESSHSDKHKLHSYSTNKVTSDVSNSDRESNPKPKESHHKSSSKDSKLNTNSISSKPKDGQTNSISKPKDQSLKSSEFKGLSSEISLNKSKDDSAKPKENSSGKHGSVKPKENTTSTSNSSANSISKPKDVNSVNKSKENSSSKPKESSSGSNNKSKDSTTKPKESSSSGNSSISNKNKLKDSSSSSSKPKDNLVCSSSKLKEGEKHTGSSEKNISSSSSKHKSSSDKLNVSSSNKVSDGHVKKEKETAEERNNTTSSRHLVSPEKKTDKPSSDIKIKKEDEKKHRDKENHDKKDTLKDKNKEGNSHKDGKEKLKERPKENDYNKEASEHRIKIENKSSLEKSKIHTHSKEQKSGGFESSNDKFLSAVSPNKDSASVSIKKESQSDDDLPLAARKTLQEKKPKRVEIKQEKRYVDDDSEDEPLSVRLQKNKKLKSDKNIKKRKAPDSDDDFSCKKARKEVENKKAQGKTGSPTKRKKEEEVQEVWKWWEEEKYDGGVKWRTLEHKGPVFAPDYEPLPKDIKFFYDGKHVELSSPAEEVATFYSKLLDHDYTTKEAFNKNFFKDWRKVMTPAERELITSLKLCNFSQMHKYFLQKSEERKNMTKEEKLVIKKQNEEIQKEYGFCVIDGHKEKIGNFKIEPPGLFRGRGEHPKMGKLKRRTMPEDVIINCGKDSKIPKPPEGHKWKEVRHDDTVTWLACWQENVQGQTKYVMLNPSSKLKGEKDWQKYEVARKLMGSVDGIREQYRIDWRSKEMKVRQRAVALYFIDKLALRAGNEKEEGESADTVGCCSLRVEHITLDEEKDGQEYVVSFDFLGKDSIRYENSVPVEKRVFKNLQLFMENKQPGDDLFDRLNTTILNKHLNELMEGLTAKVFRTFNASKTLQEQLSLLTNPSDPIAAKILSYNRANRAVAILCNHQRAIPKTFGKSMENLQGKISAKRDQVKEAEKEFKALKKSCKNSRSDKDKSLVQRKEKALERLKDQLTKLELQATDKEENKQIALGTSKLNYLDPRISVAWCKKWDVPIEKIYNRTQRDKFRWAIEMAGPDFVF